MIKLKLYITGETPTANELIRRIQEMLKPKEDYQLDVIDIFDNPIEAANDMVLATPTLIKVLPPPVRRLIGELKDRERVLSALQIQVSEDNSG